MWSSYGTDLCSTHSRDRQGRVLRNDRVSALQARGSREQRLLRLSAGVRAAGRGLGRQAGPVRSLARRAEGPVSPSMGCTPRGREPWPTGTMGVLGFGASSQKHHTQQEQGGNLGNKDTTAYPSCTRCAQNQHPEPQADAVKRSQQAPHTQARSREIGESEPFSEKDLRYI